MTAFENMRLRKNWTTEVCPGFDAKAVACPAFDLGMKPLTDHLAGCDGLGHAPCLNKACALLENLSGRPAGDFHLSARSGLYRSPDAQCLERSKSDFVVIACNESLARNGICYELLLHDPRIAASQSTIPGMPFGRSLRFPVIAGLFLAYPGWLARSLLPLDKNSFCRMTIFNVSVLDGLPWGKQRRV